MKYNHIGNIKYIFTKIAGEQLPPTTVSKHTYPSGKSFYLLYNQDNDFFHQLGGQLETRTNTSASEIVQQVVGQFASNVIVQQVIG